jgi:formamidopyrimidine-DNA glycosylase
MPELPEVETVKRGIEKLVLNKKIIKVIVRNAKLRYPVASKLAKILSGQSIKKIIRRGKYLIFYCNKGALIIHLGMSGSLVVTAKNTPLKKHDHLDIYFADNLCMRFNDPRRFGCVIWVDGDPLQHKLLADLGVEPLAAEFSAQYLFAKTRGKTVAIKLLIMNSKIIVGIGNIYANEALFKAKIYPATPAQDLTKQQCAMLVRAIKKVLTAAIKAGGTSIRDYRQADGKTGYFQQKLFVYGRKDQKCKICGAKLKAIKLGQRQTVYCSLCQLEI